MSTTGCPYEAMAWPRSASHVAHEVAYVFSSSEQFVSLASPLPAMAENDGVAFQLDPSCHGSISTNGVAPWLYAELMNVVGSACPQDR